MADTTDADALTREARRPRRRWLVGLLVLVVAGAASGVGVGLSSGGGGSSRPAIRPGEGPAPTAPAAVSRWTDLSGPGGGLPGGSQITSVIRYDGRFFAAGEVFGTAQAAVSPVSCNPAVWTSTDGTHWTIVLAASPSGSIPAEQLVATPAGLLLFQAGMGTNLWRSANGRTWQRIRLPPGMATLGLVGAAWAHGRLVAVFDNRFAGSLDTGYSEADTVWTSTNETTWHQDAVPAAPRFDSVTATASGFLAGGNSRTTGRPTLWQSPNGLTWTTAVLGTGKGSALVAANGRAQVAEINSPGGQQGTAELWRSLDGHTWTRATVQDGPVRTQAVSGPEGSQLVATARGFVAHSAGSPTTLWSSSTGETWSPVIAKGVPSTNYQVQELFPDGSNLLGVAVTANRHAAASALTTSLWRLALTATG